MKIRQITEFNSLPNWETTYLKALQRAILLSPGKFIIHPGNYLLFHNRTSRVGQLRQYRKGVRSHQLPNQCCKKALQVKIT